MQWSSGANDHSQRAICARFMSGGAAVPSCSRPTLTPAESCRVVKSSRRAVRDASTVAVHYRVSARSVRTRRKFNKMPVSRGGKCCLQRRPVRGRPGPAGCRQDGRPLGAGRNLSMPRRPTWNKLSILIHLGWWRRRESGGAATTTGGRRRKQRRAPGNARRNEISPSARGGCRLCRIHRRQSIDLLETSIDHRKVE